MVLSKSDVWLLRGKSVFTGKAAATATMIGGKMIRLMLGERKG